MPEAADRHRVVLIGDSAGGNLSAVVSMMVRDRKEVVARLTVVHQVLIYPCFVRRRPVPRSRTDPLLTDAPVLPQCRRPLVHR